MGAGTSVKLVIPSEIRLIDLVHSASEKMAEVAGFDADEALNVGLAVREAVINAMLHGNRQDPALKVSVTLSTGDGRLQAKIRDQGNGFDPESTPDPRLAPHLLEHSGRGLLLMQAFVDQVKFRCLPRGGTEVTLIKHVPAAEKSDGQTDNHS